MSASAIQIEASAGSGHRRAILFVLAASALFTVAAALIKAIGPGLPTIEIVLMRSIVAVTVLLPMLRRHGGLRALRTPFPLGNLCRSLIGFTALLASFYGYTALPLAVVTGLGFLMPLFVTLMAVPLLGERLRLNRLLGVTVGLAGVLVMLRPWNTGAGALPLGASLVVIGGVIAWALTVILIRRLGAAGERSMTIVLWYAIISLLLSGLITIPVWVTPSWLQLGGLILVGLVSAAAQLLMTEAYRAGEASLVAPFEYGAILHATILGVLFWGEWPDAWSGLGIAMLIGSGLYVWHRGTRL